MEIRLNLIDQADDGEPFDVVIAQRNLAAGREAPLIAWRVISRLCRGTRTPIDFPSTLTLITVDEYGNHTGKAMVKPGEHYTVDQRPAGHTLTRSGDAENPREIRLRSVLTRCTIDAELYRGDNRVAITTGIKPMSSAVFEFAPSIWLGVAAPGVMEGEAPPPTAIQWVTSEISLEGIAGADIELSGGGASPFAVHMTNVVTLLERPAAPPPGDEHPLGEALSQTAR